MLDFLKIYKHHPKIPEDISEEERAFYIQQFNKRKNYNEDEEQPTHFTKATEILSLYYSLDDNFILQFSEIPQVVKNKRGLTFSYKAEYIAGADCWIVLRVYLPKQKLPIVHVITEESKGYTRKRTDQEREIMAMLAVGRMREEIDKNHEPSFPHVYNFNYHFYKWLNKYSSTHLEKQQDGTYKVFKELSIASLFYENKQLSKQVIKENSTMLPLLDMYQGTPVGLLAYNDKEQYIFIDCPVRFCHVFFRKNKNSQNCIFITCKEPQTLQKNELNTSEYQQSIKECLAISQILKVTNDTTTDVVLIVERDNIKAISDGVTFNNYFNNMVLSSELFQQKKKLQLAPFKTNLKIKLNLAPFPYYVSNNILISSNYEKQKINEAIDYVFKTATPLTFADLKNKIEENTATYRELVEVIPYNANFKEVYFLLAQNIKNYFQDLEYQELL